MEFSCSSNMKDVGCDDLSLEMCFTPTQNIFDPINFGPKRFWTQNFFGPKSFFLWKNLFIVDQKWTGIFLPKHFIVPEFFWSHTFFGPKIFWPQIFLWLKIFSGPRIGWTPKFSDTKIIGTKNFFGPKNFWGPKMFGLKN